MLRPEYNPISRASGIVEARNRFSTEDAGVSRRIEMPGQGKDSFEALAIPHLDTVYRVARRLARDEHEAEDLVSGDVSQGLQSIWAL